MPKTKLSFRKQVFIEVEAVPEEYLPLLLRMIRTYRESVDLKPARDSFRQGWSEAQALRKEVASTASKAAGRGTRLPTWIRRVRVPLLAPNA